MLIRLSMIESSCVDSTVRPLSHHKTPLPRHIAILSYLTFHYLGLCVTCCWYWTESSEGAACLLTHLLAQSFDACHTQADQYHGETALHVASREGSKEVVHELLNHTSIDVNKVPPPWVVCVRGGNS